MCSTSERSPSRRRTSVQRLSARSEEACSRWSARIPCLEHVRIMPPNEGGFFLSFSSVDNVNTYGLGIYELGLQVYANVREENSRILLASVFLVSARKEWNEQHDGAWKSFAFGLVQINFIHRCVVCIVFCIWTWEIVQINFIRHRIPLSFFPRTYRLARKTRANSGTYDAQ